MSAVSASVDRLTVEAGKYLGLTAGETIEKQEVVLQAEAEGYTEKEAYAILEGKGQTIEIPEQGNLFGELWPDNSRAGLPGCDSPPDSSPLAQFTQWLKDQEDTGHSYTKSRARKRFAQAKSVGRYFNREYENYSTVLITYCADDSEAEIAQQARSFHPRAVVRRRRQILKKLGVYDTYAGVSVIAPKYRLPGANSPKAHVHTFLWIPGDGVSPDDFRPLIETHVEKVDGATSDQHPDSAITVQHWGSDYRGPTPQGPDDVKRGATSSAPYELAANLPCMKGHYDARGVPDYAQEWLAEMRLGTDGDIETSGVSRINRLGSPSRYKQIAERGKTFDRVREGRFTAEALASELGLPGSESPSHEISEPARESLIQGVSQLAQIPTPDRVAKTPEISGLRSVHGHN